MEEQLAAGNIWQQNHPVPRLVVWGYDCVTFIATVFSGKRYGNSSPHFQVGVIQCLLEGHFIASRSERFSQGHPPNSSSLTLLQYGTSPSLLCDAYGARSKVSHVPDLARHHSIKDVLRRNINVKATNICMRLNAV